MPRRILHHGPDPTADPAPISDRVVVGCWFEWHRQGGCGAGELRLRDEFSDRGAIEPGDWISIETEPGVRWYLGRVESKEATFPAGLRLRLAGMGVELGEVFPGGFGSDADGFPPHRVGESDLFTFDPDRNIETFDPLDDAVDLVRLLLTRYVVPQTHIQYVTSLVEDASRPAPLTSLKVRGEESAKAIIKELALRAAGASWGVNQNREFFFLRRRITPTLTLRIGRDITSLEEFSDRELLFNRILLTGDYVYDRRDYSGVLARRVFRWRGNFVQPQSRAAHGERRLRLWIPWIRTQSDSLAFVREFFRTYCVPVRRYEVATGPIELPKFPWLGAVRLESSDGTELARGVADAIRVTFDRIPRFRLEIGPEDPRNLWPEPPQDERWELPDRRESIGGDVSITSLTGGSDGDGGTDPETTGDTTGTSGLLTSDSSGDSDATDSSDDSDDSDESSNASTSGLTSDEDSSDDDSTSGETSDDSSEGDSSGVTSSDSDDLSSSNGGSSTVSSSDESSSETDSGTDIGG
jgi:hypothetical protein